MENEVLKSLCLLAKWAGTFDELDAVSVCLNIYKYENRKNSDLHRMCEEINATIHKRRLYLKSIYLTTNNY